MRIAFISDVFPSISQTFVLNQVTGLIDRGHDVQPFALTLREQPRVSHGLVHQYDLNRLTRVMALPSFGKRLKDLPIALLTLLCRRPSLLVRSLRFMKYGRKAATLQMLWETHRWLSETGLKPFDAIVCHFGYNGAIAVDLRDMGLLQGPIVTFFHAVDLTKIPRLNPNEYSSLFAKGERFLAITEYARGKLIRLACPESKIEIHHMGVDCTRFQYRRRRPNSTIRVISIGRMVEKKGYLRGLEAVALALEEEIPIKYTIVGDGKLRTAIEDKIKQLDIAGDVHLTGWQPQEKVVQLLHENHILLLPSLTAPNGDEEGLPVVLMEALATGMPVVATRHAGIPELVHHGVNGLLAEERDSRSLSEKIIEIAGSPELWESMGRCGRSIVEQNFNINRLNDRLERLLSDL